MSDYKRAVLAGGCFWGMQDLIRRQPGVVSTRVGYTGGQNDHPTYRNHPGHAEAVEIVYDPAETDYRALLEFFFQIHDPTTKNRQGNDVGSSYRSEIFYVDDEQREVALDTIADVDASGLWPGKVVTEVSPSRTSSTSVTISSATACGWYSIWLCPVPGTMTPTVVASNVFTARTIRPVDKTR